MSTFSELIDFTRSSTGTYLDSVVYGDELVQSTTQSGVISSTNNDPYFSAENRGQVSVSNDVLTFNNTQWESIRRNVGMVIGKYYKVSFTVNATSGALQLYKNGATNIGAFTTGTHSVIYEQEAAINLQFSSANLVGTVSNISAVEVISTAGGTPLLRTADTNEPRLEYDASGQPLGLLIEEQRTNNLPQSNNASVLDLNASGITTAVNSSEVQAPSNTETVIKLNKTGGGYGYARTSYTTVSSAQTLSVFVKKGTARYVGLRQLNTAGSSNHTTFDLDTKTWTYTGYSDSRGYQDYGNGWLRIWVTEDGSSKSWASVAIVDANGTENNSQTGTLYVYGFQREAGAFPTSYIPTSGSTVTRNQDVCRIDKEKYHLNQKKGTIYCEFDAITSTDETNLEYQRIYELATTDSDDRVTAWIKNDDGTLTSQLYDNNVTQAGYPLEVGYNGKVNTIKVATAYGVNHFQASNDGKVGSIDTSVNLDYTRYRLAIMQRTNTGSPLCGHMKRITYTPKVLSGAELIELTKPSSSPTMSLTFDGQATSELVEGLHD